MRFNDFTNRKPARIIVSLLTLMVTLSAFAVPVFAKESADNLSGLLYEFDEKEEYTITGNESGVKTSSTNTLGVFSIEGAFKNQGNNIYYIQDGNVDVSYDVDIEGLEKNADRWHLTEDKTKKVDGVELDSNILMGTIIVESSLDGEKWLVDKVYTDAFSGKEELPETLFTTKEIHQLNGCYYRVIVAYKLEKQSGSSKVLFWDKDNFEYKRMAETYTFYVIDQDTIDNGAASPDGKPRHEFSKVINTGKDNGYDVSQAKTMDKDDPFFDKTLGYFTVNGYTRETTDKDGTIVFLKTVGDDVTLWFSLTEDIESLFGNDKLSISEDKNGYDKALGVPQTNFKHGALIVKYTDEEGHSPETVKYFDFLAANAMTGADTRIQLYEEGEYEVSLDYEVCDAKGINSYSNYKVNFKFAIRNGNTMAFPRDAKTGSELKDGAWTANGFTVDLAESKYLTIDIVRREVNENADGTLSASVRNNTVGKDGATYTKNGIYEITVKNSYSDGVPTTVTLYVGADKNILALSKTKMSVEKLNELIRSGVSIADDGSLIYPVQEAEVPPAESENVETILEEADSKDAETITETTTQLETEDFKPENENTQQADVVKEMTEESDNQDNKQSTPIAPIVALGVIVAALLLIMIKKHSKKEG